MLQGTPSSLVQLVGEHPSSVRGPHRDGGQDLRHAEAFRPGGPGLSPVRHRLSRLAAGEGIGSGQSQGSPETFRWLFPAAACYTETAVLGSSKKTNVFSGDFDKINGNHLDKAHFISDKNPRVNLLYVLLNEM